MHTIDPPPIESSHAWETPVPLTEIPSAGAFPIDVLPPVLAGFTEEIAAALHCPADCVGPVLLALAASAIGASRALDLGPHCRERPALYLTVVLPPGLTLTSVLQILAEPIFQTQAKWLGLRRQTPDDMQRQFDEWIQSCSQSDPLEEAEDESLALGQDQWAKLKRWFATDATASALAVLLTDNPRGLLILRDDLAPWLKLLDSREGIRERAFFAAGWSGAPLCLDRRLPGRGQHRPIMIPNPFLTLLGRLNADHLHTISREQLSTGLLDRFLFAFPDPWPPVKWSRQSIAEQGPLAWQAILDDLRSLQPERKTQPRLVRLGAKAGRRWADFYDSITDNAFDASDPLPGQTTCRQGYAARLAVILHFLWWAAESQTSENPPASEPEPSGQIEAVTVDRAVRLVDYFQAHAHKARASIAAPAKLDRARIVLRWLGHSGLSRFSRRDAHYALRSRFPTVEQLEPVLNTLAQHGFFRPVFSAPRLGPGRPPSPTYEVNPLWQKELPIQAKSS